MLEKQSITLIVTTSSSSEHESRVASLSDVKYFFPERQWLHLRDCGSRFHGNCYGAWCAMSLQRSYMAITISSVLIICVANSIYFLFLSPSTSSPIKTNGRKKSSSSEDEAGDRSFEDLKLDDYELPKEWKSPVKRMRNEAIKMKKKWDKKFYSGDDAEATKYVKLDEFEYDANTENALRQTARYSFYGDNFLKLLDPNNYKLITRKGKAYCLGTGQHSKIFIAIDIKTKGLVCIKAFLREEVTHRRILDEIGLFLKGQAILANDSDYIPGKFLGFLKIKQGSVLNKYFSDVMAVSSTASLVPNVPLCLTMDVAIKLLEDQKFPPSKEEWSHIIYIICKAAKLYNDNNFSHGDFHSGNMLLTFHDDAFKLNVIDFGYADNGADDMDIMLAMAAVVKIAKCHSMHNTESFADKTVLYYPEVLEALQQAIRQDLQ